MKTLIWLWKIFWGKKYFITFIEDGLKEDEIPLYKHKLYLPTNSILVKNDK